MGKYIPASYSMPVLKSRKTSVLDIKVTMIGESSVGKSSIVSRMVYDKFTGINNSTIGGAYCSFVQRQGTRTYKFQVWDTAGQERFHSLVPMYLKNANIILIVFDLTNLDSYEKIINYWYEFVMAHSPDASIILVGNKLDIVDKRRVNKSDPKKFADSNDLCYIECSAKDSQNMTNLVNIMIDTVDQMEKDQKDQVGKYHYGTNYGVTGNVEIITLDDDEDEPPGCLNGRCTYG